MAFSYLVLRKIINHLAADFEGNTINTIISHRKSGILVNTISNDGKEINLIIDLESEREMISKRQHFNLPKKNITEIFNEAVGNRIVSMRLAKLDRIIQLELTDSLLLEIRFFGKPGSVVLFKEESPVEGFKIKSLTEQQIADHEPEYFSISEGLTQAVENKKELKQFMPFLDNLALDQLENKGFFEESLEFQKDHLAQLDKEISEQKELHISEMNPPELSVFPMAKGMEIRLPVFEALNEFERRQREYLEFEIPKEKARKEIDDRIRRLEKGLKNFRSELNRKESVDDFGQKADLLMANLHLFSKGITEVEVQNFYSGKTEKLRIKEKLSPQEQAEKWYSKSKNRQKELNDLKKKIEKQDSNLKRFKAEREELEKSKDIRSIRKFLKHKGGSNKISTNESGLNPYRRFEYKGQEIRVGKSGEKNDQLLNRHSQKDDLWFHVKDAAGSHVIVPMKGGINPDEGLIQRAASLAVYYSKRKNEMNCPVIMTQRKYVRKIKGAKPGLVKVEREKVIFADPKGP